MMKLTKAEKRVLFYALANYQGLEEPREEHLTEVESCALNTVFKKLRMEVRGF